MKIISSTSGLPLDWFFLHVMASPPKKLRKGGLEFRPSTPRSPRSRHGSTRNASSGEGPIDEFLDVAVDEINAVALLEETSHGQERAISRKTGRVLVAFSLGIGISFLLMILALALQRRVYADAYRAAAMDIPVAPKERRESGDEYGSYFIFKLQANGGPVVQEDLDFVLNTFTDGIQIPTPSRPVAVSVEYHVGLVDEAYELACTPQLCHLKFSTISGFFYGMLTA
ncbi:hypothetical protein FOZ62_008907, partial [Perkinsus olseni]